MPFALVVIGLLMIITGARDTHRCLAAELQSDFTGPPEQNFVWWLAAFGGIGAASYIPGLQRVALTFMALVIIVMVLAQQKNGGGGFFGKFVDALKTGPEKIDPAACAPASSTSANVSDPNGAISNLTTPLGNAGTLLGKYIQRLKPTVGGGSGF